MQIETRMMAENNRNEIEFDPEDEEQRTMFCANLNERVTEEILYELFIQSGPIESVRIPKDKDGRQRSYGFVTFMHACSVPYALELFAGVKLYNRELTLKSKNANTSARIQMHSPPSRPWINDSNICTPEDNLRGRSRYDDNRNNIRQLPDNSALRGNSSGGRYDMNMIPTNSKYNSDKNTGNMNPFNIDDLNRLGSQFLFTQLPENLSSKGDDMMMKHPSRSNRPHVQTSPYYNKRSKGNSSDYTRRNEGGRDRSHQRKNHGRRR